jgi:hypothetical protein
MSKHTSTSPTEAADRLRLFAGRKLYVDGIEERSLS